MKRGLVILLVLLLPVTMLWASGCGESKEGGRASEFNQLKAEAGQLYRTAEAAWQELYGKIREANTNFEQVIMKAIGGQAASIPPEQKTGLSDQARSLAAGCDDVKAKYGAMIKPEFKQYEGVDGYALYAKAMLKVLDAYRAVLEMGAGFLAKVEPALASGDAAAVEAAVNAAMGDVTNIQEARKKAEAAAGEAEKIKKSEGLGT